MSWGEKIRGFGAEFWRVLTTHLAPMAEAPLPAQIISAHQLCRRHLQIAAGLSLGLALTALGAALIALNLYDRVALQRGLGSLILLLPAVLLVVGLVGFLEAMRRRVLARALLRLERAMISRPAASADLAKLRNAFESGAFIAALDLAAAPILIVACAFVHPGVALALVLGVAAILAAGQWTQTLQAASPASEAPQALFEALNARPALWRAMRAWPGAHKRAINAAMDAAQMRARQALAAAGPHGLAAAAALGASLLALTIAAASAAGGELAAASLVACLVFCWFILRPAEQLSPNIARLNEAFVALKRLEAVSHASEARETIFAAPQQFGLYGVHAEIGRIRFKDLTLSIAPGEIVAVIGASGAGKTALAQLLAGALQPREGVAAFDGARIGAMSQCDRPVRRIGWLPQDAAFLPGSIAETIAGFPARPRDRRIWPRIIEAAKAAGLHEDVLALPQQYQTRICARGEALHAGLRRRLSLARALFGAPAALIIDDPVSGFDAAGRATLWKALTQARERGAAIIVFAADPVAQADRHLLLSNGALSEVGAEIAALSRAMRGAAA